MLCVKKLQQCIKDGRGRAAPQNLNVIGKILMKPEPLEFITDQALEKIAEKAIDTISGVSPNDDDVLLLLFRDNPFIEKVVLTCASFTQNAGD